MHCIQYLYGHIAPSSHLREPNNDFYDYMLLVK